MTTIRLSGVMDTMSNIMPGSRVLVFDGRIFKNDKDTPLSMTMRPAIVVCRYET